MPRARVAGLRSAHHSEEISEKDETALPQRKAGKVIFRSNISAYRLSIKRRIVKHSPDGERYEVIPQTESGTPLDGIKFEDNLFETDDMELVKVLKGMKQYGLPSQGGEFWDVEDQRAAQDAAEVEEVKRRLADLKSKGLADRVFRPGTAEDFRLPEPPPAA
jgi:hypothetical protein